MAKKKHDEDVYQDDFLSSLLEASAPFQEEVDFKMKLAAKIIKAVRSKGWNNTVFAEKMEIASLSIITKWFSGTHNFESTTLNKIQNVLGIRLIDVEMPLAATNMTMQVILGGQREYKEYDELAQNTYILIGGYKTKAVAQC